MPSHQPTTRALMLALLLISSPAAATTVTFEDVGANLPISNPLTGDLEDFYSGFSAFDADPSAPTDFVSGGATFNNDYSDFFPGCCSQGFYYSQRIDTTTPGFANQYAAITGGGVGGSATYGVGFTGGVENAQAGIARIRFDSEVSVVGTYVTNTTYAALAILNGEPPADPFGVAGAPDLFTLTITGIDAGDQVTGSVDFDLADYTFADDSLDYIVTDWTWVDLTGLGDVAALDFTLTSTDTAFGFLNTPSYFAIDDLVYVPEPTSGSLLAVGLAAIAARRRRVA